MKSNPSAIKRRCAIYTRKSSEEGLELEFNSLHAQREAGLAYIASQKSSKSYVSRILRLALLAPDIIEGIFAGRTGQGVMLEQLERPLPTDWDEQRRSLDQNLSPAR